MDLVFGATASCMSTTDGHQDGRDHIRSHQPRGTLCLATMVAAARDVPDVPLVFLNTVPRVGPCPPGAGYVSMGKPLLTVACSPRACGTDAGWADAACCACRASSRRGGERSEQKARRAKRAAGEVASEASGRRGGERQARAARGGRRERQGASGRRERQAREAGEAASEARSQQARRAKLAACEVRSSQSRRGRERYSSEASDTPE